MTLQAKVLSCYGNLDAASTARVCGTYYSYVYNTWRNFDLPKLDYKVECG